MDFIKMRQLTDTFPRRPYMPSSAFSLEKIVVKGLHYGQRKLLLAEIELISEFIGARGVAGKPILVVYAGAANGSHLPFLFYLFKAVKFVLIDPAPFCSAVYEIVKQTDGPVVELIEGYCTDELCLRLARMYESRYDLLLVSDIRSGVPSKQSNKENTAMIARDNEMQRGWCVSLRAEAALLKFHPPYPRCTDTASRHYDAADDTPDSIAYLDGVRLFGVWSPKSSSEVRLLVRGPFSRTSKMPLRRYNCVEHEEQCYYYNTDGRYARDCAAEKHILERYLEILPNTFRGDVVALSNAMSDFLHFPLFRPLDVSFTENDARWVTLLYSTRDKESLNLFESLRNSVTMEAIRALVEKWRDAEEVPSKATIGSVELSKDFWKVMCVGDLSEAYSFPRIRWRFASKLISRKTGRKPH